jgi:hypothetical protein
MGNPLLSDPNAVNGGVPYRIKKGEPLTPKELQLGSRTAAGNVSKSPSSLRDGIIGPPDGLRPRQVLKKPDWLRKVELR